MDHATSLASGSCNLAIIGTAGRGDVPGVLPRVFRKVAGRVAGFLDQNSDGE